MRIWHYLLIPYLPKEQLVSQWRECIAIKRQWEKGTLKHRLVSYVTKHNKCLFMNYVIDVMDEMDKRSIKYQNKYYYEFCDFCKEYGGDGAGHYSYPEHNDRYLRQCLFNLQEKADRGIISKEDWQIIETAFEIFLK